MIQNSICSKQQEVDPYIIELIAFFAFNPTDSPLVDDPTESDIQDAKLKYYYPEDASIYQKRNQVGLVEGFFVFCESISRKAKIQLDISERLFQTLNFVDKTYICTRVRQDFYLFFAFKHSEVQKTKNFYIPHQENLFYQCCNHFIENFNFWFDGQQKWLHLCFPLWMKCNQIKKGKFNLLYFSNRYFKYCPLDQKATLAIQFLVTLIRQICQTTLENICIFHQGQYIYSDLTPDMALLLKDTYYGDGNPFSVQPNKLVFFKEYAKLTNEFEDGFVMPGQAYQIMYNIACQHKQNTPIYFQNVYIQGVKYIYSTFYHNDLLVLLFFKQIEYNKLREVSIALKSNSKNISQMINSYNQKFSQKINTDYRFMYFNGTNLAYKLSKLITKDDITEKYIELIQKIKYNINKNQFGDEVIKCGGFWFCGRKVLHRLLILILPDTITIDKLDSEINNCIQKYFQHLFL